MRWFVFVVLMVLSACEKPCNASTCFGCCSGNECVPGTDRLECGDFGNSCVRCKNTERCVSAKCELAPVMDAGVVDAGPPTECLCASACCLPDGSCAPNNGIDACGPARSFCGTCASDQRCESGVCVAASCAGCIDPLGRCFVGGDDRACGTGGGVCQSCGTDQRCVNSACRYISCDSTNCRFGCCMPDNRCETNPGVMACGLNGDACATCGAGEQCLAGRCQ